MKKTKHIITRLRITILVLTAALFALGVYALTRTPQASPIPDLATYTVAVDDVESIVSANGNVTPLAVREVYLPQGKVIELRRKLGGFVKKNAIVAKVEVVNNLGQVVVEDIKAPIAGTITQQNVNVDDIILSPAQPALQISNENRYQIEVNINENDILNLAKGQEVRIVFPAISFEDEFVGKVKSIDPAPTMLPGAVEYGVTITITDAPEHLKLGMTADVEILTDLVKDVITVPENYLIEDADGFYVKRITWDNPERTEYTITDVWVTIGLETDSLVEITNGLRAGDLLLEPSFVEERQSQLSFFE